VEDLANSAGARAGRTFHLFEGYDSRAEKRFRTSSFSKEYDISVTDVTNALAWARREFRRIALERCANFAAARKNFKREARAALAGTRK